MEIQVLYAILYYIIARRLRIDSKLLTGDKAEVNLREPDDMLT